MTFSVGISTFNRNDDLARCLRALEQQTDPDFNIVIANGGDPQALQHTVAEFPTLRITVVTQERKGIVEARNLAWKRSAADVVCLIDDDLVVAPQWLEQVRSTFLSDPRIAGVSGPTIIPEERRGLRDFASYLEKFGERKNPFVRAAGALYLSVVLEHKMFEVGRILKSGVFTPGSNYENCLALRGLIDVDYLEACHMCYRRSVLEELGGFDYAYTGTGEWNEPDFSFKARAAGHRLVFDPQAVTYHYISQSGVFTARTNSFERSRNFVIFYRRWIKANTMEKFFRFGFNLLCINTYWVIKFLQTGNMDWLKGFPGTVSGFIQRIER